MKINTLIGIFAGWFGFIISWFALSVMAVVVEWDLAMFNPEIWTKEARLWAFFISSIWAISLFILCVQRKP